MMMMFLGHEVRYWIELDTTAKANNWDKLIDENAKLRAKVSKYESLLDEASKYRAAVNGLGSR